MTHIIFGMDEKATLELLLSTLLQDILHLSHHLLNVLLQIANKLGLSNKQEKLISTKKGVEILIAFVFFDFHNFGFCCFHGLGNFLSVQL
jgi:hypothetical protein